MSPSEQLRMIYGFVLLGILGVLALLFGLGHVEENTSFGLMPIVVALSGLAAQWAQWAFSRGKGNGTDEPKT